MKLSIYSLSYLSINLFISLQDGWLVIYKPVICKRERMGCTMIKLIKLNGINYTTKNLEDAYNIPKDIIEYNFFVLGMSIESILGQALEDTRKETFVRKYEPPFIIKYDGHEFNNRRELCDYYNIEYVTFLDRCKRNFPIDQCVGKIPILPMSKGKGIKTISESMRVFRFHHSEGDTEYFICCVDGELVLRTRDEINVEWSIYHGFREPIY